MNAKEHVQKAAAIVGSQKQLSKLLGVTPVTVHGWCHGDSVPIPRCVAIERATGGQVTRKDLRPHDWQDIWPELAEKGE